MKEQNGRWLFFVGFLGEEILGLVVVTDGKAALVGESEMRREVGYPAHDFANDAFEVYATSGVFEFGQMMVFETHQVSEYSDRGAGGGTIELVADGGVKAGAGFGLDFFQSGEEATEAVADVEVGGIEAHGDLFFVRGVVKTERAVEAGFEEGGAGIGNVRLWLASQFVLGGLFGLYSANVGLEKCLRICGAGEDSPHGLA